MKIYLVVFDESSFQLSEKLFQQVTSYIDRHYVKAHSAHFSTQAVLASHCRTDQVSAPEDTYCAAVPSSLEEMLFQEDAGFTETLLKLIDQTGKKDSEIYKRANLSKQHFSKIRNNPRYQPTKATAIALALALELDLEGTRDLIGRAGFALTNSSKFDLIIRYFIERKRFDVMEINLVLYQFDQPLLGAG